MVSVMVSIIPGWRRGAAIWRERLSLAVIRSLTHGYVVLAPYVWAGGIGFD